MLERLIDGLEIDSRFTRSIALDRDHRDPDALGSYLVTPAAVMALKQIGDALQDGHSQRAWKLIGPYGSGKSALGVLLSQLLSGRKDFRRAFDLLAAVSPETAKRLSSYGNRIPLAIVGSRLSIGEALGHAIFKAISGLGGNKALGQLRKRLDLTAATYKALPLNSVAGELLVDFAGAVASDGHSGVLLLIDELGKFVEHAAMNPEEGDLMALQQLAECACRPGDASIVVVAMLHQHFNAYAVGVGRSLNDEWHKVAARFDEIPFDEPIERYVHFAAHALGVKAKISSDRSVQKHARTLYRVGQQLGVFQLSSAVDRALLASAEYLYPLHPLSVAALSVVAKRFGQSERSFHAFLRGHEPFALRDFAQRHAPTGDVWFRLPEVFDYLSSGHGLRFRDLSTERRWTFARSVVERTQSPSPLESQILKTIAVLELVSSVLRLPVSAEIIEFALEGVAERGCTQPILDGLVERGLMVLRRQRAEYSFAVPEAVNVEALYEEASQRSEDELIIAGVSGAFGQRTVIANRHYDQTGTIRTMAILAGTLQAWPASVPPKADEPTPDGFLKLVFVSPSQEQIAAVEDRFKGESDAFSVWGYLSLVPAARQALVEFSTWLTVQERVSRERSDPWTNQYVEARLGDAREAVDRLVLSALSPSAGQEGLTYWYCGARVGSAGPHNLSQIASWMFDTLYTATPRVVNELINKERPTSAIVLARQRLLDFILEGDTARRLCGPAEFPPERLIHATLLRDTGLWQESADGTWSLATPTRKAKVNITGVWAAIRQQLRHEKRPTFACLLKALAAPPLGVRAGPASVWIVMFLHTHRSSCAVFERGSLVLELTIEHLARMFKNPATFEFREFVADAASTKLMGDYQLALASVGYAPEGESTYLEIARSLVRWASRLPSYTADTAGVSTDAKLVRSALKRATDPVALLMETLPNAYKSSKSQAQTFSAWLAAALTELSLAYRRLQDSVTATLSEAFEIPGSLKVVRAQLQEECTGAASELADIRLKSFILRCADVTLADDKWLDSVASLVVQRPLDAWTDETLPRFVEAVSDLCSHYKRWLRVVMRAGRSTRSGQRFVGLTLTGPTGEESAVFVATSDKAKNVAKSVLALLSEQAAGDERLSAAVLAEALLQLKIARVIDRKRGSSDERQQAS